MPARRPRPPRAATGDLGERVRRAQQLAAHRAPSPGRMASLRTAPRAGPRRWPWPRRNRSGRPTRATPCCAWSAGSRAGRAAVAGVDPGVVEAHASREALAASLLTIVSADARYCASLARVRAARTRRPRAGTSAVSDPVRVGGVGVGDGAMAEPAGEHGDGSGHGHTQWDEHRHRERRQPGHRRGRTSAGNGTRRPGDIRGRRVEWTPAAHRPPIGGRRGPPPDPLIVRCPRRSAHRRWDQRSPPR